MKKIPKKSDYVFYGQFLADTVEWAVEAEEEIESLEEDLLETIKMRHKAEKRVSLLEDRLEKSCKPV